MNHLQKKRSPILRTVKTNLLIRHFAPFFLLLASLLPASGQGLEGTRLGSLNWRPIADPVDLSDPDKAILVDFGDVAVLDNDHLHFRIANDTGRVLRNPVVDIVYDSGADDFEFYPDRQTDQTQNTFINAINGGQGLTFYDEFYVRYSPSAIGFDRATFFIQYDNGATLPVTIFGNGIGAPAVSLRATSNLDVLGSIIAPALGPPYRYTLTPPTNLSTETSRSNWIRIRNNGNLPLTIGRPQSAALSLR